MAFSVSLWRSLKANNFSKILVQTLLFLRAFQPTSQSRCLPTHSLPCFFSQSSQSSSLQLDQQLSRAQAALYHDYSLSDFERTRLWFFCSCVQSYLLFHHLSSTEPPIPSGGLHDLPRKWYVEVQRVLWPADTPKDCYSIKDDTYSQNKSL